MSDIKISTPFNSETENLPQAKSPEFISRGYNDLPIGTDGDLILEESTNKLAQDVTKFILTQPGSQPFFEDYGIDFNDLIGQPIVDNTETYLQAQVKSRIINGLKRLQTTFTDRPDDEQIGAVIFFEAKFTNPDEIQVKFTILTKSQDTLDIFIVIEGG